VKECIIYKIDGNLSNRKSLANFFKSLNDGKYLITAKNIKKRTLPQNAYYWSCVVPMVAEGLRNLGWDDIHDDMDAHEFLKDEFLKRRIVNHQTGEVKEMPGSTATLFTIGFNDYIEKVIKFGAEELNIQIPYPNEPISINYK
jgi:hypothetical protein